MVVTVGIDLVVTVGIDLRSQHRAFEDGPAKFASHQIALRPQCVTLMLKRATLFDGELGAEQQDVSHAQ